MRLKVEVSPNSKIEDLFSNERFVKFREYCRISSIIYLHQLESVDFVMFKSSSGATDEEKNCAKEYWKTLIDIANRIIKQDDCFFYKEDICDVTETCEEKLCVAEDKQQGGHIECLNADESEIALLISRFEEYYSVVKSYVPTEPCDKPLLWRGLSYAECQIINEKSNLFHKCTAKRFVLVKWIIDEIEQMFEKNGGEEIGIDRIYYRLGKLFKVVSFNRGNLRKLLNTVYPIEYSDFKKIREIYLSGYHKIMGYKKETDEKIDLIANVTPLVKGFLNGIFEEDIYDFNLVEGNIPKGEIDEVIRNRVIKAKDELGRDNCVWFIKNIGETIRISHILKAYIKSHEETEMQRKKLSQSISLISLSNYDARVVPLIKAFKVDNESKNSILLLFQKAGISFIREMPNILSLPMTNKDYTPMLIFVSWLSQDIRQLLRYELDGLLKNDREKTVIKMRALGATLEETGKEFGITRERIRQIEKKIHIKFTRYVSRWNPHFILNAFSENSAYIKAEEIAKAYEEMSDIFIYCLKERNCATALWDEQLQGFIVGDVSFYEKVKECREKLPDMLEVEEIDSLLINLIEETDKSFDYEDIKSIIINEYMLSGQVYHRKRMRLHEMYSVVIEKYYSEGIKVYDPFETKRFRAYVTEMFGDVNMSDNDRAIDSVITRITVLCDRGKYILPSKIIAPMDLLGRIWTSIKESDRSIIMFAELYERFKDELAERSNINNRYFLQGVLKHYYPNDFFYTRDTINKDGNNEASIRIAIEEFIRLEGRVVSKEELKQEFAGMSDAVLLNALYTIHDLIVWDFGQYLHSSLLNINDEDYQKIGTIVEEQVLSGFVTSRKLFDILYMLNPEFMVKNNIHTHISLFGVIMYMLPEKYEFKRPYICQKGSPIQTTYDILRDYLIDKDLFKISEIKEFCEDMQINVLNIDFFLEWSREEFIRVDADLCIRKNLIQLSEYVIDEIDDITKSLMMNKQYISLKKINNFSYYPDIGFNWTQFLLESIICEYSKRLKFIDLDYRDYRYVSGIITDKEVKIDTYEEILRFALIHESEVEPFKTMEEVEKWLKEQELIVKSMPQILLDRGIVTESEHGTINIQ